MGSDAFAAEIAREVDGFTVRWSGEVDMSTAPRALDSVLNLALVAGDTVRLLLDTVTFMDSTGLRCLVRAHAHVETAGARLELVEPSERVVRVVELSGLVDLLGFDGNRPSRGRAALDLG